MTIAAKTRTIAKRSLNAPYLIPTAVARLATSDECPLGIPPVDSILLTLNEFFLHKKAPFKTVATTYATNGIKTI